jgi:hypothetical protein
MDGSASTGRGLGLLAIAFFVDDVELRAEVLLQEFACWLLGDGRDRTGQPDRGW